MNHPNVVRTYGFTGHPPCLIMEYIEMNLRDLIDDRNTPLSLPLQMKVALHIAKGMAYLHSFNGTDATDGVSRQLMLATQ